MWQSESNNVDVTSSSIDGDKGHTIFSLIDAHFLLVLLSNYCLQ